MTEKMPVLFVGHGNPMNAIEENDFSKAWIEAGKELPQPRAIICVSAHWITRGTMVTAMDKPRMIYDMYGFPPELYEVRYDAPGSPDLAEQVRRIIKTTEVKDDFEWGLDHGTWSVLNRMFPKANIPVIQMSLDATIRAEKHYEVAAQLKELREEGVLIIGSGNIVHNLRLSMERLRTGDTRPYDWAVEFDAWAKEKIAGRDFQTLVTYEKAGEAGKLSVPTTDHYIPMLYSLGLAGEKEEIQQVYEEVALGGISMRTFQVG